MAEDKQEAIRLVINNAEEVPPPPPPDDDDGEYGGAGPPPAKLPDDCPVTPLGVLGDVFFYLDALQQLRAVPAREHSRLGILALFGKKNHRLEEFWPRLTRTVDKTGAEIFIVTGWKPERAAEALMAAAGRKGVWNPSKRVRGRGAWLGDDGQLLIHCGDVIYDGARYQDPGLIGRYVYPASDGTLRPVSGKVDDGPAKWLLGVFQSWSWRRGDLDAHLLLGWIGAALLAGALDWRPVAWITGGRGTGKSTLHKIIERLFDGSLIAVADASEAGLRQKLKHDTIPVAFDELEAEEDNRKGNGIIKLARRAASGSLGLRGGADHTEVEFVARSCFMFSSILIPPMLGQDRSRMFVGELGELRGEPPPDLSPATMRAVGAKLLRRLIDGWPRFGQSLEMYRSALALVGHGARGADVFGTLLACADLLLHDHETDFDSAREVADRLAVASLAEASDDVRDEEMCLQHLSSSAIPREGAGFGKHTVAYWAAGAAGFDPDINPREANRILGTYGLKVVIDGGKKSFAIIHSHVELAKLFEGTHWAGRSGTMGVWVQALRRLPMAESPLKPFWFAGVVGKATVIPIDLVAHAPDDQELRDRPGLAQYGLPER